MHHAGGGQRTPCRSQFLPTASYGLNSGWLGCRHLHPLNLLTSLLLVLEAGSCNVAQACPKLGELPDLVCVALSLIHDESIPSEKTKQHILWAVEARTVKNQAVRAERFVTAVSLQSRVSQVITVGGLIGWGMNPSKCCCHRHQISSWNLTLYR